jgi:hypothetical protein
MVFFNDLSDFRYDFLTFLLSLSFVAPKTEADRSYSFFLGFEFFEPVFVLFLDFGVADYVEKYLDDKIVVRVLDFRLIVCHLWNINELNALNVHSLNYGIELE